MMNILNKSGKKEVDSHQTGSRQSSSLEGSTRGVNVLNPQGSKSGTLLYASQQQQSQYARSANDALYQRLRRQESSIVNDYIAALLANLTVRAFGSDKIPQAASPGSSDSQPSIDQAAIDRLLEAVSLIQSNVAFDEYLLQAFRKSEERTLPIASSADDFYKLNGFERAGQLNWLAVEWLTIFAPIMSRLVTTGIDHDWRDFGSWLVRGSFVCRPPYLEDTWRFAKADLSSLKLIDPSYYQVNNERRHILKYVDSEGQDHYGDFFQRASYRIVNGKLNYDVSESFTWRESIGYRPTTGISSNADSFDQSVAMYSIMRDGDVWSSDPTRFQILLDKVGLAPDASTHEVSLSDLFGLCLEDFNTESYISQVGRTISSDLYILKYLAGYVQLSRFKRISDEDWGYRYNGTLEQFLSFGDVDCLAVLLSGDMGVQYRRLVSSRFLNKPEDWILDIYTVGQLQDNQVGASEPISAFDSMRDPNILTIIRWRYVGPLNAASVIDNLENDARLIQSEYAIRAYSRP